MTRIEGRRTAGQPLGDTTDCQSCESRPITDDSQRVVAEMEFGAQGEHAPGCGAGLHEYRPRSRNATNIAGFGASSRESPVLGSYRSEGTIPYQE